MTIPDDERGKIRRAHKAVRAKRLVVTAFADPREPALRTGDIVRLNAGSPLMMVVDDCVLNCETGDVLPLTITVAYRSRNKAGKLVVREWDLPHCAVHRVKDAW